MDKGASRILLTKMSLLIKLTYYLKLSIYIDISIFLHSPIEHVPISHS